MKATLKNELILILVTFIWGSSIVAQKFGLQNIGPLTFFCIRSSIGAVFLGLILLFRKKTRNLTEDKFRRKDVLKGGILWGLALFMAGSFQQVGLTCTTVGKAGFITSLYVVIVPLLEIFTGKKLKKAMLICIAFTVAGLYLLCVPAGEFSISNFQIGELLVLVCAVFFAIHIIIVDRFTEKADSIEMSCIQFITVAVLAFPAMLIIDPHIPISGEDFCYSLPQLEDIWHSIVPLLYSGVLSSGVAYTLQIKAQNYINPVIASLILCCESVFAAVCGAVMLGEMMSMREITGCIIMFISIAATKLIQLKSPLK